MKIIITLEVDDVELEEDGGLTIEHIKTGLAEFESDVKIDYPSFKFAAFYEFDTVVDFIKNNK